MTACLWEPSVRCWSYLFQNILLKISPPSCSTNVLNEFCAFLASLHQATPPYTQRAHTSQYFASSTAHVPWQEPNIVLNTKARRDSIFGVRSGIEIVKSLSRGRSHSWRSWGWVICWYLTSTFDRCLVEETSWYLDLSQYFRRQSDIMCCVVTANPSC